MLVQVQKKMICFYLQPEATNGHKTSSVEGWKTKKHKGWTWVKLFFHFVRLDTVTQLRFYMQYLRFIYIIIDSAADYFLY